MRNGCDTIGNSLENKVMFLKLSEINHILHVKVCDVSNSVVVTLTFRNSRLSKIYRYNSF